MAHSKDTLRDRLNDLFEERDAILDLAQQHKVAVGRADIVSRRAIEQQIADFVLDDLGLSRREAPGYPLVASAVTQLLEAAGDWRFVHPASTSTEHWPTCLRERLLTLAGNAELTVRKLLKETHVNA
jgi:hypothetical protein